MKMIREITALAACAFTLASHGAGEGATQKWVKKYVEEYVAKAVADGIANASAETAANAAATASLLNGGSSTSSNGVNVIETKVGDDGGTMRLVWEDATVYALMVTNATSASAEYGITNGFVFVWNGDGTYVNGNGEIVKTYLKSETNRQCLTWHDIDSISTNGLEVFEGNFSVGGVMLQPSVAAQITNALTTASCRRSLWQMLGDLLMPAAMAQEAVGEADDASMWYTPETARGTTFDTGYNLTIMWWSDEGWYEDPNPTPVYNPSTGTFDNLEECYKRLETVDQYRSTELRLALDALLEAFRAKQMVKTMAENLQKLFTVQGIEIKGKTPGGKEYTQTYTFSSGTLKKLFSGNNSGGKITAEKAQDKNIADEKTITWNKDANTLGLYGANNALDTHYAMWGSEEFVIPCLARGLKTLQWIKYDNPDERIFTHMNDGAEHFRLTLSDWNTAGPTVGFPDLATAMAREHHESTKGGYHVLVRSSGSDKKLAYVNVGSLGAACDDVSVTTNFENGAINSGKISLYGYRQSGAWSIPTTGSEADGNFLTWKTLSDLADDTSIAAKTPEGDDGGCPKLEVAGARTYAGKAKNHYFGTSQGEGAELGWWELPNVTTNMVIGDETTIVAGVRPPGATFDASAKVMGLYNWNYSWNGDCPLVLLNSGGALTYIPLDEIYTNGLDSCSNRWVKALEWIGDGGSFNGGEDGNGGIQFGTHDSLGALVASYVDDKSIEAVMKTTASEDGEESVSAPPIFRLKGWSGGEEQLQCDQTAAGLLVGSGKPDYKHEFLMRVGDGTLHYVPVGTLATADENTITTNAATSVAGKLAIKGAYDPDNKDKALFSTGSGIEWKDAAGGSALKFVGTDGGDGVVVGSGSTTNTVTFASASDSNVKVKVEGSSDGGVKVTIGVYYK